MARKLDSFEFLGQGRHSIYPWNTWMDGSIWELIHGRDFEVDPPCMRRRVHENARRRNGRARTSIHGDKLIFQFSKSDTVVP